MLAMTGTLRIDASTFDRRLRRYRSIPLSASQRVVLIPPIGSFLIDWDLSAIRLHVRAGSQWEANEVIEQLNEELKRRLAGLPCLEWEQSA
ncbi:hypothetical protein EYE40_09695 [Glaciihabitans arcticus]|uniref:DUF2218 domain-containing protein n=1 Tax=Glaciihabitans arcticus TaxID=2668039 RepID=A0A4Q9GWP5_9MICO|nr:hypothetical protein [Glaciihabitans arcticus]TBN57637.1 hypothetical protein EYE40_09695 [Glaciihabitans arcticus]